MIKKELAKVEKASGEVVGPYKTAFAGSTILIDDKMADVEVGDVILRTLPNGKEERSRVTEATFYSVGAAGFGEHYQIRYEKGEARMPKATTQNINISGAQSVQVGDHNTQNILNSMEALVQKIEASSSSPEEKQEAKALLAKCLSHPLVTSILGAAAGGLIS